MSEYISTYSTLYLYSVNTFVLYTKTKSYVKKEAVQIITALLLYTIIYMKLLNSHTISSLLYLNKTS